eukprot:g4554.t1
MIPPNIGVVLPSCAPPTLDTAGGEELRVVVVFSASSAPVLSVHLQAWGTTFEACLSLATANLERVARADVSFERHPTGCRASQWQDGFDATRAVLLPHLLVDDMAGGGEADAEAAGGGDLIAVFASNQKVFVAKAQNPLALCLAGDLSLDVADTWSKARSGGKAEVDGAGEVVSMLPWRLSGGRWARFRPRASRREFGVPRTREEVEAVLSGAPRGRIPVFGGADQEETAPKDKAATVAKAKAKAKAKASKAPKSTPAPELTPALERVEELKAVGNAALKEQRPSVAAARYGDALQLLEAGDKDRDGEGDGNGDRGDPRVARARAVLLANRSLARLTMAAAAADGVVTAAEARLLQEQALADAAASAAQTPGYAKAHHRQGAALRALGRAEEAEAALAAARRLQAAEAAEKKEARRQRQQAGEALKKAAEQKARAAEQKAKAKGFLLQEGAALGAGGKSENSGRALNLKQDQAHVIRDVDISDLNLNFGVPATPSVQRSIFDMRAGGLC